MPPVLIILVCVVVSGSATTVSTDVHLYSNVGVDDKAFSQDVIFEQSATSAVHCAAICKQQEGCVTFTFNQEVCRGHTMLVTLDTTSTPAPGARSFTRVTWIGTACVSDSDCSQLQANTSCFDDTCVCTPGFFYSISSDTCVSECPPKMLKRSYTMYKDYTLWGHDDVNPKDKTVMECIDLCNANPDCLSLDVARDRLVCHLSYSVATNPGAFKPLSGYEHYQRHCQ